jgi:Holliday junction resolvasome RuvABC DNA-binding subunit
MLGFQKGASEKVLKKIFKESPDLRVEEVIRIALKQL